MAAVPNVSFTIQLVRSDIASSEIVAEDPNFYGPGIQENIKGYFVITQPDGVILTTGSFASPSIYWNGSALTQGNFELRLQTNGDFQQGLYTFVYHVIATGYDETILTKTTTLTYASPAVLLSSNIDTFTPLIGATDSTVYTKTGYTQIGSVVRSWSVDIVTASGVTQTVTGTTQTFAFSYLGDFYDARYDVTFTTTIFYNNDSDTWLTISDQRQLVISYDAYAPPTLIELLDQLTAYKVLLDQGGCICGTGCCTTCAAYKSTYTLGVSIFTHIIERGRFGLVTGLTSYLLQLQKLLNNCVAVTQTHTNEIIPAYFWGTTGFGFFKQMIVGSGVNSAPAAGATTYTDTLLIARNVQVFLSGVLMPIGLSTVQSITFDSTTGTITWFQGLNLNDIIEIYIY